MPFEAQPVEEPSRKDSLLETVEREPESIDDLEVSMLLLDLDSREFREVLRKLGENPKSKAPYALVFALDDPDFGETDHERVSRLRQMEACLQDRVMKKYIASITVKGRAGEQMIEPNVFSSGVKFVEIEA